MASYLKQMEELEKLKKKTEQITEKLKTAKQTGASSGAPSSSQKTVIGPTQWNPNSTITTLPKAGGTMPKAANNVLPRAEDSMSGLERASRIGNIEVSDSIKNRGDNIVKGIGTSLAASPMLLVEATKQSLGDWRNKVKTQGMEKALTDYAYNLDNPDYNFGSNPIDKNSKAYQNYAKSQEYYAKALEGLTPTQQKIGQTFISMLESASTLPTALINPSAPLLLMGAKSGANKVYELTNEGKSATEAAGRGILSGAIEALTEKIPLDDLLKAAKGGRSVVKNLLKQANVEGAEELTSYIMNYAADVSANDENARFSLLDAIESYGGGFVSGAFMGGASAAIGNYMPTYEQTARMPVANEADVAVPRAETPMPVQSSANNSTANDVRNVPNLQIANSSEISDYIDKSLRNENTNMFMKIGEVSDKLKNDLSKIGLKANNFVHALRDNDIRHIDKSHGLKSNDKYKVGKEDYLLLNDIFNNYDVLYKGYDTNKGNTAIAYEKTFDNKIYVVEEVYENGVLSVKQIIKTGQNSKPSFLKKYQIISSKNNANVASSMTRSTDYINSPPGDHVQDVTLTANNSIPESTGKINTNPSTNIETKIFDGSGEGDFDLSNTLTDTDVNVSADNTPVSEKSNSALGIVNPDVQELFEATRQLKENSKSLHQSTISGWAPFERMAKADTRQNGRNITALVNRYGQKGGTIDTILTRGMYGINGNKVDNRSYVEVASQVPKAQKTDFNTYWHELHNIDRQAQGKPVTEHTIEESKQIVADMEKKYPQFKQYRQDIADYYDLFLRTWGVGSGLISQESYLAMKKMYPNYIPTFRVDDGVSGGGSVKSGKKIRGSNAIGRAKGSTAEVMSFDEAIAKKMSSIITAATKNDISREIFSFAQALPAEAAQNGILIDTDKSGQYSGQIDIDDYLDNIDKDIARQISKGNYEVTFYDNGKPQTMKISRDVWEAYNFLDNKLGDTKAFKIAADLGRFFTNPMRAMTTTYNPLFFLTNLIRDAQTYTMNNTAKNSAVAMKNYIKAIKGIATRSETYEQYRSLGGSQNGYYGSNMYSQAEKRVNPGAKTFGQKALGVLKSPLTAIEAAGEFTEKIPRYAEYLNTIDRYGNTDAGRMQASLNAADVTVNFNRSSTLSTLINAWVPYFNAGLQGMNKTVRQIKAHPIQTTARATVSVFLPTLLLYMVNKDNPYWEDVKDGVRDNYYLIPNFNGPVDEKGYAETFIRLPKSREFGALFSASFERFVRALNSEEDNTIESMPDAFDGYLDTLLNSFMPNSVLDDNIFGAMKRLGNNTAWHGGKIVPSNLVNVSPQNQYDINTSGIAMNAAKTAERFAFAPDWAKSPMKVDYMIDSYGGYMGDLLQGLTSRKNIGADTMETVKNSLYNGFIQPVKNRFSTDSAYSNYNLDRFYDRADELEIAANDRNIEDNLPTEYVTPEEKIKSDFAKASGSISDLTKQERAILESAMPIWDKNAQIRELKKQKNAIAKDMLTNEKSLFEEYARNYVPELSTLSSEKQEDVKAFQSQYGISDYYMSDIIANYRAIKEEDKTDLEKTLEFYGYLDNIGFTDNYSNREELNDLFKYGSVSNTSVEKYNSVSSFINPAEYANLDDYLDDVTWAKGVNGAKSKALKNATDDWIADYGLNLSNEERRKLYLSVGVGKTYAY